MFHRPENEFNYSYFFRYVPFEPYKYRLQPDGAAVGKYTPQYTQTFTQVPRVTKDKFTDTRKEGTLTHPKERINRQPPCTQNEA